MAELDELEQEELDKKLMETERPPQMGLPSVPNHEPGKHALYVPLPETESVFASYSCYLHLFWFFFFFVLTQVEEEDEEEAELRELRESMAM